ncbi:unnamed protein product [Nyctereutes procyonoides]|uniref:(raccoon dog) hypothetical protein n=1 Tax=Nyctereutes procyonoides TaxID=34880 RepID=A0A811YCY9_NYCPR|nr:unnamed protein product [Nyctereutes procyonoides]
MVAAGARAHAAPRSRRPAAPTSRLLTWPPGPAAAPAPPRPFIAPGARGPSPGGFAFQSGGSLRAANQRGKPVGGGGFKRRQIAAPSGRWTGRGLEGVGGAGRGGRGGASWASVRGGARCGSPLRGPPRARAARTPRPRRAAAWTARDPISQGEKRDPRGGGGGGARASDPAPLTSSWGQQPVPCSAEGQTQGGPSWQPCSSRRMLWQ